MSIIRILPDDVSNRIAAGEVIERPASVVKELVENSLDAGAGRISVKIEQGGKRLIQIVDDGCGMDREDAMLCIEAHATSKIRQASDIERIVTLGFRGEALPSIASVSRFRLQTRRTEDDSGTELLVEGGALRDVKECGCAPGTNIRVRNLFYSLPARRKFLRSSATEASHVQEAVLLHALSHPGVAIDLAIDGQHVLQAGATDDLGVRVAALVGRDTLRSMLPVRYGEAGVTVTGYVSRPGLTRSTRREQRVFVNGRPAQVDVIYFGIRDAYHTLVMKGRYPLVALFVDVPPEYVDVNVHPAKREVRFRDGRLVGQVVGAAVRKALREVATEASPAAQPGLAALPAAPGRGLPLTPMDQPVFGLGAPVAPPALPLSGRDGAGGPPSGPQTPGTPSTASGEEAEAVPAGGAGTSPSASTRAEILSLRVLGTVRDFYIVAEGQTGVVLVDQHAAHERVLFERLLQASRAHDGAQQPLLLPVTVDLPPADLDLLVKNLEHFSRLGFGLEPFGGTTVLVTGVPPHFPQENVAGLLRDVLDELRQSPGAVGRPDEVRIAQAACKHAVRAEDPLTAEEIRTLLRDLARTEMPYTCPHGRPVMINLPFFDLEKRFGRRG